MTKEIYISSTPHETRLAVVEDDQLAEIYYERENEYTLAGSVYKGKVTRVLPGMQSAFVDIGLERDAFLYVTDFAEEQEDVEEYVPLAQGAPREGARGNTRLSSGGPARAAAEPAAAPAGAEEESDPGGGGRRWRGRRGRRRGRGNAPEAPRPDASAETFRDVREDQGGASEATAEKPSAFGTDSSRPAEFEIVPETPSRREWPARQERKATEPSTRGESRESSAAVLPGESLSKYGGGRAAGHHDQSTAGTNAAEARPAVPASSFRPSTLVAAPLGWDGGDVLPGETLSRYKNRPAPRIPAEASTGSEAAEVSSMAAEVTPVGPEHRPAEMEKHDRSDDAETLAPTEASASYRFDPSAPSTYRQSVVAEPAEVVPAHDAPVAEDRTERATFEPVASPPEPFFGEPSPFAQPSMAQEAYAEPSDIDSAEDTETDDAQDPHTFDPGHGDLEEEMIDEEEPEGYATHAHQDNEEYDDLVEETLDVQMDSGLLSELVRDQHIEQRTRFTETPENGGATEPFDEEEASFHEEPSGIELEEIADEEETADEEAEGGGEGAATNADAARRRPDGQRGNRRGMRGQQRHGQGGNRGRMRRSTAQTTNLPAITELLKPNQEILVQIAKEPIARKGARITSHIALPGRFLVFMPTVNHVGVSRKIASDEERQRLKRILLSEKGEASGGFIVRTAAAAASEEDLRADIRFLLTLWAEIKQRADSARPPALIYHDLSLVERVLRDQVTDNFSAIWVDSEADYERVLRFLNRFEPALVRRVKLYTKETPLFEQFGIQEEINKALRSKVWLKSGGSIVINQTEALVAIDINTGKYVGKTARLEDTILKTNLDAIPEIVRQIRLRDLGGIIVIDFIDMDERKNRNRVMQALEEALKSDRAPSKVLQFNDFGLVAITRKRVKQSLERTLSVPCFTCDGTGMVKGPVTVCNEIYVELRKMHRQIDRGDVLLRVNPEVVKQLKAANGRWLSEMEEMSGKTIIVKSDAALHPEQFDIH